MSTPDVFYVQFTDNKCIAVDNWYFYQENFDTDINQSLIDSILPDEIKGKSLYSIYWCKDDPNNSGFNAITGGFFKFDLTEENYNKYCKPYADMWQVLKDKQEQEWEEQEAERNKFENRQARALIQLNAYFETVKERAHIVSSLGFTVDANSTANENITGLLLTLADDATCQFCDYYNQFHELNKTQLTTLQNEIIQNAQNLYNQKWQYRTAIENCVDNDGLDAVIETIEFTYMDFTQTTE